KLFPYTETFLHRITSEKWSIMHTTSGCQVAFVEPHPKRHCSPPCGSWEEKRRRDCFWCRNVGLPCIRSLRCGGVGMEAHNENATRARRRNLPFEAHAVDAEGIQTHRSRHSRGSYSALHGAWSSRRSACSGRYVADKLRNTSGPTSSVRGSRFARAPDIRLSGERLDGP